MKKYIVFICIFVLTHLIALPVFSATWSVDVTADKEDYTGGETASFTIALHKDGVVTIGNSVDFMASFPGADYSAVLNPVEIGFSYEILINDIPAEQILQIKLYEKNHEEEILKNEEKIQKLQQEIAELEQEKLEKPDKADKIDEKIAKVQQKITDIEVEIDQLKQPLVEAEKTVTVLSRNAFTIEEGAFTNHQDIKLLMISSDSYELMVSENEDFSGAGVIPYQPEITYNLSSGDGEKTVYVKFFLEGTSFEEVKSTLVILDTVAPVVEVLSPIDGTVVTGRPE